MTAQRRTILPLQLDIPHLTWAIVLVAVFAMAARVPASPDTWWHLRCGEVQWRTRTVLKSDVFSHTAAGQPWINQSWLPQLFMYGLFAWGGFPFLALGVAATVTATWALGMLAVRGAAQPAPQGRYAHFWRALVVLWAAVATGRVWAARPHLVTFLLAAAWIYLLDRHRRKNTPGQIGVLWWLPPLMLLWANSHGGYIVGLVLIGAEIGGLLEDALWQRAERPGQPGNLWTRLRPLLIVTLLCLLAASINPQGIHLLLFPFQTLGSYAQQQYVAEWASPDFHAADLLPFLALLLATWSALALAERRVPGAELLRLLGFTAMALRSARYLGLAALVMAPLLARYGALAWRRLAPEKPRPPAASPALGSPLLNWVLLFLILAAAGIKVALPLDEQTISAVHEQTFPVAAAGYMQDHDLPPTLFNDYAWGGYLIWRLYPGTPVFIDGRADPYGDALIATYRQAASAQEGWEAILDAHHVQTALISAAGPLALAMRAGDDWQEVYRDELAVLFVRRARTSP